MKTNIFKDKRGELIKYFYSDFFNKINFIIDDVYTTRSDKNVVRGLHHQREPYGQSKLVTCLSGEFVDFAVDLRPYSITFGQKFSYTLTGNSGDLILIPSGCSHGTYSLKDDTVMLSMCSGRYMPDHESGIDIKSIGSDYDFSRAKISDKDLSLMPLDEYLLNFKN